VNVTDAQLNSLHVPGAQPAQVAEQAVSDTAEAGAEEVVAPATASVYQPQKWVIALISPSSLKPRACFASDRAPRGRTAV